MSDDKVLILIPAKGCSKRVPRKNIRELNGVPLIYYVIKEAFRSGLGDVYVSTEDKKVAKVVTSPSYLERHPHVIVRPKHLAEDPSTVADVALHALGEVEDYNIGNYSTLIILLPTCPLMKAD
ncbi:MAG: acylneuraminate cytidylyltransferase family protein, partial [Deltaproteobacteria bacterium]